VALRSTYKSRLEDHLTKVASYKPSASTFEDQWRGLVWPTSLEATWHPDTGVEKETLKKTWIHVLSRTVVFDGLSFIQEIHPRLQRHVKHRLETVGSEQGLDWATAEVCFLYR
jgi:probable 2-oxoglutarate dehydrogenase E1 component DHKTD1